MLIENLAELNMLKLTLNNVQIQDYIEYYNL